MSFKVGDRCKIYGMAQLNAGSATRDFVGETVVVTNVDHGGWAAIKIKSSGLEYCAHPKQLRKLKPRRRVWISEAACDALNVNSHKGAAATAFNYAPNGAFVEFVEVRKK